MVREDFLSLYPTETITLKGARNATMPQEAARSYTAASITSEPAIGLSRNKVLHYEDQRAAGSSTGETSPANPLLDSQQTRSSPRKSQGH